MFKYKKGFTLIELLVVIAIIGLLSTIAVLGVIGYRQKAQDARIGASLSQLRSVAAMVLSDDKDYLNICVNGTLNEAKPNLAIIESEVMKLNGGKPVSCFSSETCYCAHTSLVSGGNFCVDYLGYAGSELDACSGCICQ
ncbi:MAG: type II secretion system protein [Candidatus Pacebacteria bacterium]|nr:type II secretion system protein [Candidatus Paceibacterota bacterium]